MRRPLRKEGLAGGSARTSRPEDVPPRPEGPLACGRSAEFPGARRWRCWLMQGFQGPSGWAGGVAATPVHLGRETPELLIVSWEIRMATESPETSVMVFFFFWFCVSCGR